MFNSASEKATAIAFAQAMDAPGHVYVGRAQRFEALVVLDPIDIEGIYRPKSVLIEHDIAAAAEAAYMDALSLHDHIHGTTPFEENR